MNAAAAPFQSRGSTGGDSASAFPRCGATLVVAACMHLHAVPLLRFDALLVLREDSDMFRIPEALVQ